MITIIIILLLRVLFFTFYFISYLNLHALFISTYFFSPSLSLSLSLSMKPSLLLLFLGLFAGLYGTGEAVSTLLNQRRNLKANTHWASDTNNGNDDNENNDFYNTSNTKYSKRVFYNENSENNKNSDDEISFNKNEIRKSEKRNEFSRILSGIYTPTMSNPIVCISAGSSVIFDITNTQYPIYLKDSLLNTNPSFDYWEFRKLSSLAVTSVNITSFAFTFISAGERNYDVVIGFD